jgi:LysM repeat protein
MVAGCAWSSATALAQQTVAQQLAIVDEKLSKLTAEVEALQFSQKKLQEQVDDLQAQVLNLRKAGSTSSVDLDAIQAQIRAVDAAREKDKQIILDTLAKELSALSGGKSGSKPVATTAGKEHVVQKGETLTSIAKQYGVTVAELRKVNNLPGSNISVGQKLTIPGK